MRENNPTPPQNALSWKDMEKEWDKKALKISKTYPLKTFKKLPKIPGITKDALKNLRWNSLKYLITNDLNRKIRKGFMKRPLSYSYFLCKSFFRKKPFLRDDDFFLYGLNNIEEFKELLSQKKHLLILGFSYCQKPLECPSGRFTEKCLRDLENPICQQCFIAKLIHLLPKNSIIPLFITTIHYIGEKVFEIIQKHKEKNILFIITACELTLNMFGDLGNMVNIKGIGVKLEGRICNTIKAFELSEKGKKPGLTVVQEHTKQRIFNLIQYYYNLNSA